MKKQGVAVKKGVGCPPDFPLGVYETLEAVESALQAASVDHAVGGAVAMYTAGYVRNTGDVDVFVEEMDAKDAVRALRRVGLLVQAISEEAHWTVQLPRYKGTRIRADLLIVAGEPEASGIGRSIQRKIGGVEFPCFRIEFVVLSKATIPLDTDEGYKSRQDIGALFKLNLFNPKLVLALMSELDVPFDDEFKEIMLEIRGGK